jgi:CheY-like chemotaxis protein
MLNKFKDKFKLNLPKNNKKGDTESDTDSTVSSSPGFFVSKVLIVDDVTVNRYILRKYVEKCRPDIQIYEANNGVVAVEMNEKYHFDMIFIDLRMPGLSGEETTIKIKEKDSHVRIIGCTGNIEKEVIRNCLEIGMLKVLGKPLDKKEIEYILNGNGDSIYS